MGSLAGAILAYTLHLLRAYDCSWLPVSSQARFHQPCPERRYVALFTSHLCERLRYPKAITLSPTTGPNCQLHVASVRSSCSESYGLVASYSRFGCSETLFNDSFYCTNPAISEFREGSILLDAEGERTVDCRSRNVLVLTLRSNRSAIEQQGREKGTPLASTLLHQVSLETVHKRKFSPAALQVPVAPCCRSFFCGLNP